MGQLSVLVVDKFYTNYEGNVTSMENYKKETNVNVHGGIFANLTDRGISKQTAEKYGVKVVYDMLGS